MSRAVNRPTTKRRSRAAKKVRTLSHLDPAGRVRMVDVGDKPVTRRVAVARGRVTMAPATVTLVREGRTAKGDVLATAHLAGVMAAKRTSELIPLAHPVPVDGIHLTFTLGRDHIAIEARVTTSARTGVEMEALTAVSAAALTLYDMLKSADRDMVIGAIALWEKSGGRRGPYRRNA
jgi:cyclic pyranopterin phosphate synthase